MDGKKGLLHIYTGKGKGKTSAALGLALRAIGWGFKVCIFQFMKEGENGEARSGALLEDRLKVVTFSQKHPIFYHKSVRKKAAEKLKADIPRDLHAVREAILIGNYDIVILDEIVNAIHDGFVEMKDILPLLEAKFRKSELVFTGRGAPEWLIELADYVTEMRLVKHPYKKGLAARKGIEF